MFAARIFAALFAGLAVLSMVAAASAKDPVYTGRLSNDALDGYDAVAYFTEGAPVKGDNQYTHDYNGARWKFSSAENRDAFAADPEQYAPQYGGYCAWALSEGYTARGNPKNWRIVDGKLYVNYNKTIQDRWEKDIPGHIEKADGNWPAVLEN